MRLSISFSPHVKLQVKALNIYNRRLGGKVKIRIAITKKLPS